jgi:membrane-bound serine protease (ClpP class)
MFKRTSLLMMLLLGSMVGQTAGPAAVAAPAVAAPVKKTVVYVIPVKDEINSPTLYILRRGLKEAIEQKADVVLLDMNTPGGALDVTFEIMEALEKFPGQKLTFVDREAMSAGAFISAVTDEIYFAPNGVIGAAAPVLSTGGEIDKSMKQKVVSYLRARMRATSEGKGFRGQVISAMIDEDYELKIGEKVLKPKGELLSLTATEALEKYGEPPQALLGAGKAADVTALLSAKYGANNYEVRNFQVTWSESLAKYLTAMSPILMGLGLLALFVEFKTPGFGWPGTIGILLLALVFLGNYGAGLSGHEPALLFVIGVVMVAAEIIFFPGIVVVALTGVVFMLGSLVWAGADYWPNQPMNVNFSGEMLMQPVVNLGLALVIAIGFFAALLKYLPKTGLYQHLAVQGASTTPAQTAGIAPQAAGTIAKLTGRRGIAVTGLFPSGEVEVEGRRYQAKVDLGFVEANSPIVVTGHTDFGLTVEKERLT